MTLYKIKRRGMNKLIGKEETYVQASINGYIIAKDCRVTIDSIMRY